MIPRYTRPEIGNIWSDEHRYATWLKVEVLACEAMNKMGQIPDADLKRIQKRAAFDVKRIFEIEEEVNHDVIAFLTCVAENVGPSSRYIHKGLTSSDVLDTALAVNMVEAIDILIAGTKKVIKAAAAKAKKYKYVPMIGRSHGIHAEPITFGLKMALMYDEFQRALTRLEAARNIVKVGQISGAVGTHAHIDPKVETYVCRKLKLQPAALATQVLQRDRHAEYITAIALVGSSIDRWATEFRHLQRTEVYEVEEFFGAKQKGSSAMPHKKNPITGEKLSGLARLLRGYAIAAMENVPLWHERDISHSSVERVIMPDATIALDHMLIGLERLTRELVVFPKQMIHNMNLTQGLHHSQQVLLLLTEKKVSREISYRIVQRNALRAWEEKTNFKTLLQQDQEVMNLITQDELDDLFDLRHHMKHIDSKFKKLGLSK